MCVNRSDQWLTVAGAPLPSGVLRRTRILFLSLLAATLMPGTALAAPGDPYFVYTANSFSTGAVILRTEPGSGSIVEISRNGPQGNLFQRPYDLAVEPDGKLLVADIGVPNRKDGAVIRVDPHTGAQTLVTERSSEAGRRELDLPFGIAIESDGNLVVSNRVLPNELPLVCRVVGKVVRVNPITGDQTRVSGDGRISWPLGLAVRPDGDIVVANECGTGGGLIRVDRRGLGQHLITPNDPHDLLVTPERVAFDPDGRLLVSDFSAGPDGEGGIVSVDAETGAQSLVRAGELFNHPLGIAAVVNRPPSAALALPPTVAAGRAVRLDASSSGDPEHLPLVYEWDLDGDGSFEAGSGGNPTAPRGFATPGAAA